MNLLVSLFRFFLRLISFFRSKKMDKEAKENKTFRHHPDTTLNDNTMGIFKAGKKKQTSSNERHAPGNNSISSNSFRKEFMWGFTQGNPMHHSQEKEKFYQLIQPLTGVKGTITIGASFHPYQIMDQSGKDVWEIVYQVIQANDYCDFNELVKEPSFFHMTPPGQEAFPVLKWSDERLFHEVNPEFATYVPFLVPYLTYDDHQEPRWSKEIQAEMNRKGNAHEWIDKVNDNAKFLMPEPTFIVGFGMFDKQNKSALIDRYVRFLNKSIKKQP